MLKVGSVVSLNSGGALMTVASLTSSGYVVCEWHDFRGRDCKGTFSLAMLTETPPPDPDEIEIDVAGGAMSNGQGNA